MRIPWKSLAATCATFLLIQAAAFAQVVPGIDAMVNLDDLPYVRFGVQTLQVSSHDKLGLNYDGFSGLFVTLYSQGGEEILFDEQGPGCLYRMWFAKISEMESIRIYVDESPEPVVQAQPEALFSGELAPFLFPLAGGEEVSSGGYYSYLPVPFRKRLVVAAVGKPYFLNFTYHRFASAESLTSFTGVEEFSIARIMYTPENTGSDPKGSKGNLILRSNRNVRPDQSWKALDLNEPASIRALRVILSPVNADTLAGVRFRIFWDRMEQPLVDAPIGHLFASPGPDSDTRSLMVGRDRDGVYYCYFPMPFWENAEVVISNEADLTVSLAVEVQYLEETYGRRAGYFGARFQREEPTTRGRDYLIFEDRGTGHVAGVSMLMEGDRDRQFLEGDERFYFDWSRHPAIHGTGTEDYFNGGWFFNRGTFALSTHGHPLHESEGGGDRTGCYRLHIGDLMPYYAEARLGIEHDAGDIRGGETYSSVTYFYRIPDATLHLTDSLDVGDSQSEALHDYRAGDVAWTGQRMFFYEGEEDDVPVLDQGRRVDGASSFSMRIHPDNEGVRLRRRFDQGIPNQRAQVQVDGQDAGVWYVAGQNAYKRWRESDFDLPPELTRGKDVIRVRLVNLNSEQGWTEHTYWAYSFLDYLPSRLEKVELVCPQGEEAVGETVRLEATGAYTDGSTQRVSGFVRWERSNPSVGQILYGSLAAAAPGTDVVTAIAGGLRSEPCTLTVVPGQQPPEPEPEEQPVDEEESACGFAW